MSSIHKEDVQSIIITCQIAFLFVPGKKQGCKIMRKGKNNNNKVSGNGNNNVDSTGKHGNEHKKKHWMPHI